MIKRLFFTTLNFNQILIILFFLISIPSKATKNSIDNLKVRLAQNEVNQQVKIMCDLCWEYRFIDYDSAIFYGSEALKLAQKLEDKKGVAQALNDLGIIYIDHGRYNDALSNFGEAMKIRMLLGDSSGVASIYNKSGIVFQKQGKLDSALKCQLNALEIYEKLNLDLWVAYSLNNIAIINFNLGDLNNSLFYHQKGLELRMLLNDSLGVAGSYGNIANVLSALGDTLGAILNYQYALQICKDINNKEAESVQLNNLGAIYIAKYQYEKALSFLIESLKIRTQLGDKKAMASSMLKIGESYMKLKNFNEAYKYFNRAKIVAKEINVNEELVQSYMDLSILYSKRNKNDSAYKYLKLYSHLKDSVNKARLEQQIIDAKIKYDVERKDKDIQLLVTKSELNESKLKQRKTNIWLLVFIIISISGAMIFLLYRKKQKQKEILDEARIIHNEKMIAAVINSQEEERRKIARELHDGVGQSLAGIKLNWINNKEFDEDDNINKMLDNVMVELRSISHQMMPRELEQFGLLAAVEGFLELMLGNTQIFFNFEHLNMNERLSPNIELGIFRILQELTGNIIKHSQAKYMGVQLLKRNNRIILIVTDDGIGFDTKKYVGNGIGLMNIESRVDALKGKMNFESSFDNGTEVSIRIPINE